VLRQAEGHRARERATERKGERRSIGRESRRDGAIWKKGATGRWAAARRRDPAIRSWGRCDFVRRRSGGVGANRERGSRDGTVAHLSARTNGGLGRQNESDVPRKGRIAPTFLIS